MGDLHAARAPSRYSTGLRWPPAGPVDDQRGCAGGASDPCEGDHLSFDVPCQEPLRDSDQDVDGIPDGLGLPNVRRDADTEPDHRSRWDGIEADGDGTPETRRAGLAAGVVLPAEVRDGEVTLLLPASATTAQGRPLQVRVRCIQAPSASAVQPRSLTLGDVAPVDVTTKSCHVRQRSAGVSLDVDAGRPTTVIVTVQAPPTADARAYRSVVRYRIG